MRVLDWLLLVVAAWHLMVLVILFAGRESNVAYYLARDKWCRAVRANMFFFLAPLMLVAWRIWG